MAVVVGCSAVSSNIEAVGAAAAFIFMLSLSFSTRFLPRLALFSCMRRRYLHLAIES